MLDVDMPCPAGFERRNLEADGFLVEHGRSWSGFTKASHRDDSSTILEPLIKNRTHPLEESDRNIGA